MAANEIAYVEPGLMLVDEAVITIPVGTMAVIPHAPLDARADQFQARMDAESHGEEIPDPYPIPPFTLLVCEQTLHRINYPELSPLYPDGGFYDFTLPNMTKKFILGIDAETNEIKWGDGVIYYQSVPVPPITGHPQLLT